MKFIRCQIECRSTLATPLAADTLWGHVAWGIRYSEGEDALRNWLDAYEQNAPPLILSDPFPAGLLPRPILPPRPQRESLSREKMREQKKQARRPWLPLDAWKDIADGFDAGQTSERAEPDPYEPTQMPVLHAAINRLTGGTAQEDGGTLYADLRTFFKEPPRFDVYALSPESPETVRRWLEQALCAGYGRDASSGVGDLRVLAVDPCEIATPPSPNAGMLLAPASPRRTEPTRGFARVETRAGRLGGHFAIAGTPDGTMQPQKHPVTRLERGSILLTDDPPPFVGRLLDRVHPYEPIRHYAMAPVLPCRLDDSLLKEVRP